MAEPQLRAHEVVLRHVETELAAHRLPVGARLPGERAFAAQLGVSRTSIREALRVLEAMGIIRTAAGSGPDAGAIVVADAAAGLTSALRLHVMSSALEVGDIVQARLLLESWTVRAAAGRMDRATPDAVAALAAAETLLDAMDDPDVDAEAFQVLDAEFHVALSTAAGNPVVAAMMTSLRGSIRAYVSDSMRGRDDWAPMARRLRGQHRRLLAAIRVGDADAAEQIVRRHIEGFYRATAHPERLQPNA